MASRSQQASDRSKGIGKPLGILGRVFLVFCRPLPACLSIRSVVLAIGATSSLFLQLLSMLLVFSAPLTIPLLVWMALGAGGSGQQLTISTPWQNVHLPALSTLTAYALLAAASAAIHLAQLARQTRQQQHASAQNAALTAAFAQQRPLPPVAASPSSRQAQQMESPFQTHRKLSMARSEAPVTPSASPNRNGTVDQGLQAQFRQLNELQLVLFGQESMASFSANVARTVENLAFETGRLAGIVGVDPPAGGGGSCAALDDMLQQLRKALT